MDKQFLDLMLKYSRQAGELAGILRGLLSSIRTDDDGICLIDPAVVDIATELMDRVDNEQSKR